MEKNNTFRITSSIPTYSPSVNVYQMKKNKIKINYKKMWMWFFVVSLSVTLFLIIAAMVMMVWFSKDLPTPTTVVRRDGFTSRIYDRNGELIFDLYKDTKRTPVVWDNVPDILKKATISIEDKDFYKHKGFDPLTPFRILKNVIFRGRLIGGSTLTQQLVKNVLLTNERTVTRKIKEFILAVQIDAKYKKDDILLMYFNEAPYGGAAWGVGTASEIYFAKPIQDIDLAEAVILAGLPQRPSVYSPFSKTPTAYIARSEQVLRRMVEDGYISTEESEKAFEEIKNYKFNENKSKNTAPHFIHWLKDILEERYGEAAIEGGGLKITSTLDMKMQNEVQTIVGEEIDKAEKLSISNGAALVIDPRNGQVLAMVGSRDYFSTKTDGKFNVVTQALRQPGSTIKPITYLTALKKGFTAESMIMDTPVTFKGIAGQKDYSPSNYTGKFVGPLSIRKALGNSVNVTAVKVLAMVGVENMLRQAYDMGISTLAPTKENMARFGLSVTLGGAEIKMTELAAAYSAFANQGKRTDLFGILKVEDKDGRVLEDNTKEMVSYKQVISPQEAFIISHILADNSAREITFGANNALNIPGYQVAVKTGTTNDKRDNWCIGWTPNLLSLVWVGNNDNSPMGKVASGVSGASPIWRRIMLSNLPTRTKQDFPIPDKIISMEVDSVSGYPAHDGFSSKMGYFIDGTQPKTQDPIHLKLKVCKGKDGLATPEDVKNNNYDEKEYFSFKEDCESCQAGIDKWISEQADNGKYFPPSSYCRDDGMITVNFDTPSNEATVGNEFEVKIKTNSVSRIVEARLWVNGDEKNKWNEKPFETKIKLNDGIYTLKVEVKDVDGKTNSEVIKIGVNMPWNGPLPTAVPTPTEILSPTPTPGLTVIPSGT
jgi:1A family penicillin-binding protein